MDKKDIYEHLAKIYLDASSKKKKKASPPPRIIKNFSIAIFVFLAGIIIAFYFNLNKTRQFNSEVALILLADTAKINFHFDPAKKETYTINLNKLNISRYRNIAFSLRKVNYQQSIPVRIEFTNSFKEKSEVYLRDISGQWHDYKIPLSDFKNITDWSEITKLTFTVEEWNVKNKKGLVYIDNVRLLK